MPAPWTAPWTAEVGVPDFYQSLCAFPFILVPPLAESTPSSEAAEPPLHKCLKKSSSTPSRSLDSLPTMDSAAPPLQHLAKSRPKRAKTRAATRATVARADDPLLDAVQPSTGMDAFYANRPLSPSGQAPPSPVAAEDNDK